MTDEHLAVEDQETSKIERRGWRRENTRESTEVDESGFGGATGETLSGLGYCLRAQYLINSAAAKAFTLEVESWVRLGRV